MKRQSLSPEERAKKKRAYQRTYWSKQRLLQSPAWKRKCARAREWQRQHYVPHPKQKIPEEELQRRKQAYNTPLARYYGRYTIAHCGAWHVITALPFACPTCHTDLLSERPIHAPYPQLQP